MKKQFFKLIGLTLISFSVTACNQAQPEPKGKKTMPTLEQIKQKLDIDCVKEAAPPPLSNETQILYNYAYYQDLHQMASPYSENGDATWQSLLPYYRIAAANGNYKANIRLQYLIQLGKIKVSKPKKEVIELNELLAKTRPATAYYNLYIYLGEGYGVKTERLGHYAYLRKAAEMGSRDAQHELAFVLFEMKDKPTQRIRYEIGRKLLKCAAEQGHGAAANFLGIGLKSNKKYTEAVKAFHLGAKNGDEQAALALATSFEKAFTPKDEIDYLALPVDLERAKRYKIIQKYLSLNRHLNPKVPELDQIVPLPPAKLPAWDGKIAFQRWYEGESPQQPSVGLMQYLAERAHLDWQTGLPK